MPDPNVAPLADVQEAERLLNWFREDEFGGVLPCESFIGDPERAAYCERCDCSWRAHEWLQYWTALKSSLLVLSHAKEQGEKELQELKKKIMRDQPRDADSELDATACKARG